MRQVRRQLRLATVTTAAAGLVLTTVVPAAATPGPGPNQWWFDSWGIQQQVWPITKGKGVTVAVIDTGVNAKLPDLAPAVLPGADLTGHGGDGRQDYDSHTKGHGTGMASLIASRGTKSGFVGIAPEAKILPISASLSGRTTGGAVRFAVDRGAKVINISQASHAADIYPEQCPPELISALEYAADKDVVVVAGAGNSGNYFNKAAYPASCPGVVAVGALARNGKPWVSTQRQGYVTVGAPGTDVGWIGKDGHVFAAGEGTSQASALTSGAIALVRSRYPQMSARQVVQRITNTAKDFGAPGRDDQLGYGVVSIPQALKRQVPANAPNPVYERLDKVRAAGKTSAHPGIKPKGDSGSSTALLLIGGAAAAAVIVLGGLVAGLTLARRRRGPAVPAAQPHAAAPLYAPGPPFGPAGSQPHQGGQAPPPAPPAPGPGQSPPRY